MKIGPLFGEGGASTHRRFRLWGAFCGEHSPRRVAAYGIAFLIGYALLFLGLAMLLRLAILIDYRPITEILRVTLFALAIGLGSIWIWLLVALWSCAPNANSKVNYYAARTVSALMAGLPIVILLYLR